MLISLTCVLLTMILSGCASVYTPSARMLQIRQSMDKQQAVAIISNHFVHARNQFTTPRVIGDVYIAAPLDFDDNTEISFTPEGFSFEVVEINTKELKRERYVTLGMEKVSYARTVSRHQTYNRLADIYKIWPPVTDGKAPAGTIYNFIIYSKGGNFFVPVNKENIDELLAALTVFAPRAKLITFVKQDK